ncbi:lysophospholipid acyltransferase family protein [Viscerimonas tarda]
MFNKIAYYLIYGWLFLHALLPLRLLYVLSDILYLFVYYIAGYRIKIVRKNLKNSFPEKSPKELLKLEKDFYHHFCDYFVETIKLLHISDKEMQERMIYKNIEVAEDILKTGNSCLMYLGHYGNWEWIPSITLMFDKNILLGQIYKHLSNKIFDRLFLKLRSRFGSVGISKGDTLRNIVRLRREGKQMVIGFIADQTPSRSNIHYWTMFLNQETPVFTGVERIAKLTGFGVAYLDITRVARGKYIAECKLISKDPKAEPEFFITGKYIHLFEETILRNPAYWLWSHNRWKYKKQDFAG